VLRDFVCSLVPVQGLPTRACWGEEINHWFLLFGTSYSPSILVTRTVADLYVFARIYSYDTCWQKRKHFSSLCEWNYCSIRTLLVPLYQKILCSQLCSSHGTRYATWYSENEWLVDFCFLVVTWYSHCCGPMATEEKTFFSPYCEWNYRSVWTQLVHLYQKMLCSQLYYSSLGTRYCIIPGTVKTNDLLIFAFWYSHCCGPMCLPEYTHSTRQKRKHLSPLCKWNYHSVQTLLIHLYQKMLCSLSNVCMHAM